MSDAGASMPGGGVAPPGPGRLRRAGWAAAGAATLLLAAGLAGAPARQAPWIIGDEYLFIADNPEVSGAPGGAPAWRRWARIFGHVHGDLYQPLPILSYAVEWSLWGQRRALYIRQTDVLLHAVNGLLLWAVLVRLLRLLQPAPRRGQAPLAWALALLWLLHPTLVGAYAADMGRTHILSGTFGLLSLWLHLKALERQRWSLFAAASAALILAMMSKAMVGWVGLVLALEWALLGLRATLRSPRVYLVAAVCAFFAVLTYHTSQRAGLIADSQLALFGDPLARSFLALWIYVRDAVAPLWQLSTWYLPDIHTGWSYPLVWVGVLLTLAGIVAVVWTGRRPAWRGVGVGLAWFGALLLPVLGLVGGRAAAAQDRYLYQPLMGLGLALGVGLERWLAAAGDRRAGRRRTAAVLGLALSAALALLLHDRQLCYQARDTLRRARRVVALNPGDPRAVEALAIAESFHYTHSSANHRPAERAGFRERFRETLRHAARLARQHPEFFRDRADQAAFYRRLSHQLWLVELYEESLRFARRARQLQPEAPLTWLRLAHAYRALGRWGECRAAYEKLERVLDADDPDRGVRLVEFGDLLLNRFDDPRAALAKFRAALRCRDIPAAAALLGMVGAARCEVLAGQGLLGYELARQVLEREPANMAAWEVIGLYHLRSHHWPEAARAYAAILERDPTRYEALRGFHEVCVQTGRYRDAALAWDDAVHAAPGYRPFQSYLVWAAALAGQPSAAQMAEALLAAAPDDRFACLSRMLLALRARDVGKALSCVRTARAGTPLPQAKEFVRAAETLRLLASRGELPAEAAIVEAALRAELGQRSRALGLLEGFLRECGGSAGREQAEELRSELAGADR